MDSTDFPHILIISQVPPPVNGSTKMTELLVYTIGNSGRGVTLVDKRFSRSASEVGSGSLRKVFLVPGLALRLVKAIVRKKPVSCIYFLTNRRFSFAVDYLMLCIICLFRIEIILYLHTNGYSRLASGDRFTARLLQDVFRKADKVVTLSQSLIADVSPFLGGTEVAVIPNAVPDPLKFGDVVLGDDILFLSNLIPSKGAHEFVLMASQIAKKRKDSHFHIVGAIADEQYAASLNRMMSELDIADRVTLHGSLYGDDLDAVRRKCAILVFPSTYEFEALPLAVIESFSFGMPVAAYNVGGLGDAINDDCGYLALVPDIQLLEAFVDGYLGDPALRARLSHGARQSFERHFGLNIFARSWDQVLGSPQIAHLARDKSVRK